MNKRPTYNELLHRIADLEEEVGRLREASRNVWRSRKWVFERDGNAFPIPAGFVAVDDTLLDVVIELVTTPRHKPAPEIEDTRLAVLAKTLIATGGTLEGHPYDLIVDINAFHALADELEKQTKPTTMTRGGTEGEAKSE